MWALNSYQKNKVKSVAKIKIDFRYDINKLKNTVFKSLRKCMDKKPSSYKIKSINFL